MRFTGDVQGRGLTLLKLDITRRTGREQMDEKLENARKTWDGPKLCDRGF
jgi:hypothetical protein